MVVREAVVAYRFTSDAVLMRTSFREALPYIVVMEAVLHEILSIVPMLPVILSA